MHELHACIAIIINNVHNFAAMTVDNNDSLVVIIYQKKVVYSIELGISGKKLAYGDYLSRVK